MAHDTGSGGLLKANGQLPAFSHLGQFKALEINEGLSNSQGVAEETTFFSSEWESFQNRKSFVSEQFFP